MLCNDALIYKKAPKWRCRIKYRVSFIHRTSPSFKASCYFRWGCRSRIRLKKVISQGGRFENVSVDDTQALDEREGY